jgi:hypothetical protein
LLFQKTFKLKETGIVDEGTNALLFRPMCSYSDIIENKLHGEKFKVKPLSKFSINNRNIPKQSTFKNS